VFAELVIPKYNNLIGRQIGIADSLGFSFILGLVAIIIITGIIAGLYPALKLSSFQPIKTLKGETAAGRPRVALRNILVIVQFAISISLISVTFIMNSQINYLKRKDLGFDKENVILLPLKNDEMRAHAMAIKNELNKIPQVIGATASSDVPSYGFSHNGYMPEGVDTLMIISFVEVDDDFLDIFNLKIVRGRNFNDEFSTDKDKYLINESFARELGWEDPIGKQISRNGKHEVIGVVKDFNFSTLHEKIEPLIITEKLEIGINVISAKISKGDIKETLDRIETVWGKFAGDIPFEFYFMDDIFDLIYQSELKFRQIFFYFSTLAIFIAILGLFGLAAYTIEQRTKEIGIRKVLGASFLSIIVMLAKEFFKSVIIATVIAVPIAYWFISDWLENFAYKIQVGPYYFILAGAIALFIAVITITFHAIKAALTDPIKALRYE
jgi:putative ABC transport system permease protein